jgi:hypothetical protein
MAFILAFAAGLTVIWLSLGVIVTASFRGPDTELPLTALALPLPGIVVFRLVFSGLTGLWRGPLFWLWAVAATYGLGTCATLAAAQGWLSWPLAAGGLLGLLGALGLWLATAAPRSPEAPR